MHSWEERPAAESAPRAAGGAEAARCTPPPSPAGAPRRRSVSSSLLPSASSPRSVRRFPWRIAITSAVAVPEGNGSFSRWMTCLRRGTAKKTPKNASAQLHAASWGALSSKPPLGGFSSGVSCEKAGMMPTNPAASGMVAVATAVVWTMTFSAASNPRPSPCERRIWKSPKPSSADCRLPIVTHPVCSPKYMLVQQRTVPTTRPTKSDRHVKDLGGFSESAGRLPSLLIILKTA
mmetsp:Transcript_31286/g.74352  ORF Transcript_31286/g.74352 Transcript_31286/m.74352 type:complete len:234 (-) Transcript_31286:75-776(-)